MLEISNIGLLTAFAAGAISFLSPCVLPLVPGYLSYVAGHTVAEGPRGGALALRLPAVGLSVCFVLGFSTVFVLLGASATALANCSSPTATSSTSSAARSSSSSACS